MKKLIAAFNISLDGFSNYTAIIRDNEIHQHYTELLTTGNAIM